MKRTVAAKPSAPILSSITGSETPTAGLIATDAVATSTFPCPYCSTPLAENATRCHLCDWVLDPPELQAAGDTWVVALLSLVPGLGHIYRGHLLLGSLVLVVVSPFVLLIAGVLAPATVGLSLLLIPIYLGWVMLHAAQLDPREPAPIP